MGLTQASALLTGSTIASSFDQLLFLDAASGLTEATLKVVSTKVGKSALQISDEHVLIKGVDTSNAAAFAVHTTGGALIFGVAADTPAVTVGVDDTGADVRVYSATTNEGLLYDASEDELGLLLTTKLKFHDIGGGEEIYASADGHLEVNSGTTLDITAPTVDINASTAVTVDTPDMQISANDDSALAITAHHATNSKVPKLVFKKSAGTKGAPGIVADGESLGKIEWYGYNTTTDNGYELGGFMHMVVDAGVAANNDMPTQWVLGLSPDGSATPTTRCNFLSSGAFLFYQADGSTSTLSLGTSGDVTVDTGNLVIGTADKGISFANAGDVGDNETVSSSVLDDYEVGYATATITAGSAGGTVNLHADHDTISYIKVGNLVTITGEIAVTSISSSPSGQIQINMPFTGGDLTEVGDRFVGAVVTRGIPYTDDVVSTCVRMTTGLSYICLAQTIDNGTETHIGADVLAQYDEITFTITIMVA